MGATAQRDPFDQRRSEVGPGALRRPLRRRVHGEIIVAIDPQRRDAEPEAAVGERRRRPASEVLRRRDRPVVVDDVQDDRRLVGRGEHKRSVEVGLGRGPFTDPRRRDLRAAPHRRRHRPPDRLDVLRRQVARDREEPVRLRRVHHRELAALQRVEARWTGPGSSSRPADSRPRSAGPADGRSGSACRPGAAPAAGRRRSPPRRATACRTRSCPAGGRAAGGRRTLRTSIMLRSPANLSSAERSGTHSPTAPPSSSSTRTICLRISATRSTFSSSAGFFISPALLMNRTRSAGRSPRAGSGMRKRSPVASASSFVLTPVQHRTRDHRPAMNRGSSGGCCAAGFGCHDRSTLQNRG